jgi:hypothetical protein
MSSRRLGTSPMASIRARSEGSRPERGDVSGTTSPRFRPGGPLDPQVPLDVRSAVIGRRNVGNSISTTCTAGLLRRIGGKELD